MSLANANSLGVSVETGEIGDNQVTDAKIAGHVTTKITGRTGTWTASDTITSSKVGDVLIPNADNQGNIGSEAATFANVRATNIQSGDIVLMDKKTKEKLYLIDESKRGIAFRRFSDRKVIFFMPNRVKRKRSKK